MPVTLCLVGTAQLLSLYNTVHRICSRLTAPVPGSLPATLDLCPCAPVSTPATLNPRPRALVSMPATRDSLCPYTTVSVLPCIFPEPPLARPGHCVRWQADSLCFLQHCSPEGSCHLAPTPLLFALPVWALRQPGAAERPAALDVGILPTPFILTRPSTCSVASNPDGNLRAPSSKGLASPQLCRALLSLHTSLWEVFNEDLVGLTHASGPWQPSWAHAAAKGRRGVARITSPCISDSPNLPALNLYGGVRANSSY